MQVKIAETYINGWIREMEIWHDDFFSYSIGGQKPFLSTLELRQAYAPGHQVSSDQWLGLAAKTQAK